ncbi:MAG TPA: hypothetical protein VG710_16700 [Opitutus sp.]|nr:hypothetical protein [Opitutus sp.]
MSETWLVWCIRVAGVFHFITLVVACFTPVPPNWDENLAKLPEVHRRFAIAQNFFIGATIAFFGVVAVGFAPQLIDGSAMARIVSAAIALWWGGRLMVLPWLRVWPHLRGPGWQLGFILLHLECATYAVAFGWLALRHG